MPPKSKQPGGTGLRNFFPPAKEASFVTKEDAAKFCGGTPPPQEKNRGGDHNPNGVNGWTSASGKTISDAEASDVKLLSSRPSHVNIWPQVKGALQSILGGSFFTAVEPPLEEALSSVPATASSYLLSPTPPDGRAQELEQEVAHWKNTPTSFKRRKKAFVTH
jgi:hypothetical protein